MEKYRPPANRSIEGLTFFVTTRLFPRRPLFANPCYADIAVDCLQFFRKRGELELYYYVIMPDHVHLIFKPKAPATLPSLMRRFKTYVAHQIGKGPIWGEAYWSEDLPHARAVQQKMEYVHRNPLVKGLVADPVKYRWSSAWALSQSEPSIYVDMIGLPIN